MTYRVLPPASGPYQSMTINGRTYSATPGGDIAALNVPDFDVPELRANGWAVVGPVFDAVVSAEIPAPPSGTFVCVNGADSALFWDGQTWRLPSGNVVD